MSSTTQKHENFLVKAIGENHVSTLPGVAQVLGKRLVEKGIDKAYMLLGQYLVLKKDKILFQEWMKDTCNASSKQSGDCYEALKDWCTTFMN